MTIQFFEVAVYAAFAVLLLVFAGSIFFQENPVYAIFYLILCFCCSAFILFCQAAHLFAIFFILIYVGAIAVLFLFVVMMVNIKKVSIPSFQSDLQVALAVSSFTASLPLLLYVAWSAYYIPSVAPVYTFACAQKHAIIRTLLPYLKENSIFDDLPEAVYIGQTLFNDYGMLVYLAGCMLFLALVVSIYLTIEFKTKFGEASKEASKQIARKKNYN